MRRGRTFLLAASTLAGLALAPSAAGAAGGVDVRLNQATAWPNRELVLSLPAKRVLTNDQVTVLENGQPVRGSRVTSAANSRKRGVMLAIDASLTMRGEPISQAMVAARSFAHRRSENTPLGVMFFSRQPRVALRPTTDPRRIKTTLAVGPGLTRGTKIFDAAAAGINALHEAGLTSGAIIVLSDGAEAQNGSEITLPALGALARRSGVRIFSVGLDSRSFNASSLRAMAADSGGRYGQAARPADLPPLFAAIGERLSREYLVSYRSTAPAGTPIQVQTAVDGFAQPATVAYSAPQLPVTHFKAGPASDSKGLNGSRVLILSLAAFLVLGLVVYLMLRPKHRSVVARVGDFAGTPEAIAPTLGDVRRRPERESSDRWRRYTESVELADIGISPTALVLWTAIGTVVVAWYFVAFTGHAPLIVLALAVPVAARLFISSRLGARRLAFEEQLPDNLQVLASALRAGYSFSAGLASMADDSPEPSRTEFRRATTDEQLGVDVADSLHQIGVRMQNAEIEYVGIVARMQRETGGNTAEVLDQVIETIRSRQQLKRMVRGLTAQGRLGGVIISAMPVVVSVGMAIINPGYFDPMFRSATGVILLFAGIVMLVCGWLIIRKVVDVEP